MSNDTFLWGCGAIFCFLAGLWLGVGIGINHDNKDLQPLSTVLQQHCVECHAKHDL